MRSTKKSLLASGLSLLVCLVLLIGTTFAWFTDSVTNSGNKIQAGTLDIGLDELRSDGNYVPVGENPIFDYELWEPGYSDVAVLRVSNLGSLALKFNLQLIVNGDAGRLGDVIDVYALVQEGEAITRIPGSLEAALESGYVKVGTLNELMADPDGAAHGVLYAANNKPADGFSEVYAGIVLHMQETAGNEYQGLAVGTTFDIRLNATQYTYEEDGFGNSDYDVAAKHDFIPENVTETNNNLGISLGLEWAIRCELKEAGIAVNDNELLSYEDLRQFSGKLDLSGYQIGSTITPGNAAMGQYPLEALTEEDRALFDGFTVPWAISNLAYGLMGVTELDLANTGIEYIPSLFLIGNPTIETITLPDTVISIGYTGTHENENFGWGYNAFAWMKELKTINVPSSLEYMADYSFAESPNLELNIETIPALTQSGRKIFRVVDCINNGWMTESKVTGDVAVFAEKNINADLQDFIFEGTAVTGNAAEISDNPLTYKSTFGNIQGITGTLTIPKDAVLTAWMFDAWSIDTINISYATTVNGQAFANNNELKTVNVTYTGTEPTEEEKDTFISSLFNGGTKATVTWLAE